MLAPQRKSAEARASIHGHIMAHAKAGDADDDLLARMLASRVVGLGVLPGDLGLGEPRFVALLARRFPGLSWPADAPGIDPTRLPEREDLIALMLRHAGDDEACRAEMVADMAAIVAAACMGSDHLWEDLGLWSRADLTCLMQRSFPSLAAKNDRDMKWKKFLYKQLCQEEGIYVCRAPSCEACRDYPLCFGPET